MVSVPPIGGTANSFPYDPVVPVSLLTARNHWQVVKNSTGLTYSKGLAWYTASQVLRKEGALNMVLTQHRACDLNRYDRYTHQTYLKAQAHRQFRRELKICTTKQWFLKKEGLITHLTVNLKQIPTQ